MSAIPIVKTYTPNKYIITQTANKPLWVCEVSHSSGRWRHAPSTRARRRLYCDLRDPVPRGQKWGRWPCESRGRWSEPRPL